MSQGIDRKPLLTLALFLCGGVFLFVVGLFLFLTFLRFLGVSFDSSVLNFYPFMAGIGALFGFERWWAYEQGPVNPFHD